MNAHLTHSLISIFVIIVCLLFVIGIHECGHALAARFFGIRIERISLGFGKTLKRWTSRTGCQIELNLLLIGGRLHLSNSRISPVSEEKLPYCFDKKPIWVRTIVLLSGSLANLITAFLALACMMLLGFKQFEPVIGQVTPASYAAIAELHAGDRFISVAKQPTPFWRDVGMQFIMNAGKSLTPITVHAPSGEDRSLSIDLRLRNIKSSKFSLFEVLGIVPDTSASHIVEVKRLPLGQALHSAWNQCGQLILFFILMIKQIVAGHIPFAMLVGPFKLFETMIDSFFQGLATFLYFLAHFSIAMTLVNLLPLPSLDGGSIIYGFIEKIRGKPISIALELLLYRLFFIILVLIFIQLILNDLRSYHIL